MRKIEWKSSYEIGHTLIDTQHQALVELINKLLMEEKGSSKSSDLLVDFMKYAQEHFVQEEEIMAKLNFPELELHKTQHLGYILKGMEFANKSIRNHSELHTETLTYLKEWLLNHILLEDKKIATYLKK